MKKVALTIKKLFSVFWLASYLMISGYSLFHFHQTNYIPEDEINIENKTFLDTGFHHNEFCQLFHFNGTQLTGDIKIISDFKPSEILIKQFAFIPPLISADINSLFRRGPPSII